MALSITGRIGSPKPATSSTGTSMLARLSGMIAGPSAGAIEKTARARIAMRLCVGGERRSVVRVARGERGRARQDVGNRGGRLVRAQRRGGLARAVGRDQRGVSPRSGERKHSVSAEREACSADTGAIDAWSEVRLRQHAVDDSREIVGTNESMFTNLVTPG